MKIYKVKVNGNVYEVELESVSEKDGSVQAATPVSSSSSSPKASGKEVKAPVAGNILELKVTVGSTVKKGDVIAILEAMKLENEILSPTDGVVKEILVNKGQTVTNQQLLVVIG